MEIALATCCGKKDIVTNICLSEKCGGHYGVDENYSHPARNHLYKGERLFGPHESPKVIQQKVSPEVWDTYYKFSIIRNPWDRVVSVYWWLIVNVPEKNFGSMDFTEFVKTRKGFSWLPKYHKWFKDVDFLIRFENLKNDYEQVCNHLKVTPVELAQAKGGMRKSKKHYSEYYTEETKQIVADHYEKDVEHFGYKFSKSH
jgi:hypothetical protein